MHKEVFYYVEHLTPLVSLHCTHMYNSGISPVYGKWRLWSDHMNRWAELSTFGGTYHLACLTRLCHKSGSRLTCAHQGIRAARSELLLSIWGRLVFLAGLRILREDCCEKWDFDWYTRPKIHFQALRSQQQWNTPKIKALYTNLFRYKLRVTSHLSGRWASTSW